MTADVLTTADGERLAARWWRPAAPTGEVVVVVHGFCGGKDTPAVGSVAARLVAGGRTVLAFDLRGHRGSTGHCSLGLHERLDVDAAVAAARREGDVVLAVGSSLGAVATLDHVAWPVGPDGGPGCGDGAGGRADGAVLVAAPAHWKVPLTARGAMAVVLTQTWPGRTFLARRAATRVAVRPPRGAVPVELMRAVTRPVAILHGLDDRFLPPGAARMLHALAPEPRRLDLVPGMGHGLCAEAVEPIAAAVDWVSRMAGEPAQVAPAPSPAAAWAAPGRSPRAAGDAGATGPGGRAAAPTDPTDPTDPPGPEAIAGGGPGLGGGP
ncbi:MAG TPA: alpha/beta hydrolase [Acidimicrobiales bacterium]|nr:alpha/beta hydrolase [Acidimicrobiales bacterium]